MRRAIREVCNEIHFITTGGDKAKCFKNRPSSDSRDATIGVRACLQADIQELIYHTHRFRLTLSTLSKAGGNSMYHLL